MSAKVFKIQNRCVGVGHPCLIIGEVAQAHDGSLGMAHAFIDAIADAGADAVKFQTHVASAESTLHEPWRVQFSLQDTTRYDYWRRMEFSEEQWYGLKRHADERQLLFLSSPFSNEAVDMLDRIGVTAWKLASGEITNTVMIERILAKRLPILLSTGMSPLNEIDSIIKVIKKANVGLAVLQCTSLYPCPPEQVGINMIPYLRARYKCSVGLSDHSGTIFPGLAATVLGADVVEVHVTLSREMFGPDVIASLTTAELAQLVKGIRFIEKMMNNPIDKNEMSSEIKPLRDLFTKSIVARVSLPAGTILEERHLAVKKPGTGIPVSEMPHVIGRRLLRGIEADDLITENILDLEGT